MIRYFLVFLLFSFSYSSAQNADSLAIRKIYSEALTNGKAYGWLEHLSLNIGQRLTASDNAAKAIVYVEAELNKLNLDKVYKQEVMVPHWIRGEKEQAWMIVDGKKEMLSICALGGSVATPLNGISGELIEVKSGDELNKLTKSQVAGKIIFMNYPMDQKMINTYDAYSDASTYRWKTSYVANTLGAKAAIVRSMSTTLDDFPHTGRLFYNDSFPPVPGCALSTIAAEKLSNAISSGKKVSFYFKQNCQTLPDVLSYNVVGEIKGSEYPDEIIVVGGHLDSWDLGQGAHDDGAGIVHALEVMHFFKSMNIHPKRTIRFVAFINEEYGARGGYKYAELARKNMEKHIAAIESDAGGFSPRGFFLKGTKEQLSRLSKIKSELSHYEIHEWIEGNEAGTDIDSLSAQGALLFGLYTDSQRYFDLHHAANDTFDKINRRELALGAAVMASLVWMISEHGFK